MIICFSSALVAGDETNNFFIDKFVMTAANLSWLCLIKLSNAFQQCPTHVTLPKSIQFII